MADFVSLCHVGRQGLGQQSKLLLGKLIVEMGTGVNPVTCVRFNPTRLYNVRALEIKTLFGFQATCIGLTLLRV